MKPLDVTLKQITKKPNLRVMRTEMADAPDALRIELMQYAHWVEVVLINHIKSIGTYIILVQQVLLVTTASNIKLLDNLNRFCEV